MVIPRGMCRIEHACATDRSACSSYRGCSCSAPWRAEPARGEGDAADRPTRRELATMPGKATVDELIVRWQALRARGEATTVEELCRDCLELLETVQRTLAGRAAADPGSDEPRTMTAARPRTQEEAGATVDADEDDPTSCLAPAQKPG